MCSPALLSMERKKEGAGEPEYLSDGQGEGAERRPGASTPLWQLAEWDVGGGAWVLPPLASLAAGPDGIALSKRFLLATGGQVTLTNTTALLLAALLPGRGPATCARLVWLGRAGLLAAACATVLLETSDWCGKASDHDSHLPHTAEEGLESAAAPGTRGRKGRDRTATEPQAGSAQASGAPKPEPQLCEHDGDLEQASAGREVILLACHSSRSRLAAMALQALGLGVRLGVIIARQPSLKDPWTSHVPLRHVMVCTLAACCSSSAILLATHRQPAEVANDHSHSFVGARRRPDVVMAAAGVGHVALVSLAAYCLGGSGFGV